MTPETALATVPKLRPLTNGLTIEAPVGASVFVQGRPRRNGPVVTIVTIVAEPGEYRVEVDGRGGRKQRKVRFPDARALSFGS